MRPEYDEIKFYSASDLSIGYSLSKAVPILEAFTPEREYTDINEILEFYNIQQLINVAYLPEWDDIQKQQYKNTCKKFPAVIGRFFAGIDDSNFIQFCDSVYMTYWDDFWNVFVNLKAYARISKDTFLGFLRRPDTVLGHLLHRQELVNHFGHEFAEIMRESDQTAKLIVSKFLENHDRPVCYYFPKELSPSEFNDILQKSIDSGVAGFHTLQLLVNAQSTGECPISDKLRRSAKHAAEAYWEKRSVNSAQFEYGIGLSICEQSEWKKATQDGNNWHISYDAKWLTENLDYPTILDNFAYTFEHFDRCGRSTLVSKESQAGILERFLQTRGIRDYPTGTGFNFQETMSTMQTGAYYNFLSANGVRLEEVFRWFFSEYLPSEFQVHGFRFNPPTAESTIVEKCRSLASEMDGVLKQFKMYVEDSEIDWELFAMSSNPVDFIQIPSFHKHKYAYIVNERYKSAQHILFSDQSLLSYTEKTQEKYETFYDLMLHERMHRDNFERYHEPQLQLLIDCGALICSDGGALSLNKIKCDILRDDYKNEVVCPLWVPAWQDEIEMMFCEIGLRYGCTLFSVPEAKYLNYMLNKSEFSNGLDLRNKYIHSSYLSDDKIAMSDYVRLLKVMVLVVGKINEEFDLRERYMNIE